MKTPAFCLATLFTFAALFGCGGGTSSVASNPAPTPIPSPTQIPAGVAVTIMPNTAIVVVSSTLQFTATVSGTANQSVSWAVNNVVGGTPTLGTITTTGIYTAPGHVPVPQLINVTAVSQADTTKSATATLTLSRVPPTDTWQRTGPNGGTVTVLAEDLSHPGTLYAGADDANAGAVWKSVNGGTSWTALVTGVVDNAGIFDIAVPASGGGNVIYVDNGSFARSQNGGTSWILVTLPKQARAMAVDPSTASIIYLSAPGTGLFKSQDSGTTWNLLPGSPIIGSATVTGTLHNPLAVDRVHTSTIYYGTDHGMFVSRDGGVSWTASTTGFTTTDGAIRDVAVDPADPTKILALAGIDGSTVTDLYQSTDQGTTWTLLASGLDGERVVPDPLNATLIYLSGFQNHAVYKSVDSGHTFAASDNGIPTGGLLPGITGPTGTLLALTSTPGTLLSAVGGAGVFRSANAAQSWSLSTTGISSWLGDSVAVDSQNPTTIYLGTLNAGGIFKSIDGGITWTDLIAGSSNAVTVDPFDSTHLLAELAGRGLIESHDAGASWQTVTNLPPPPTGTAVIVSIAFHPTRQGTIFISTQSGGVGLLRSTDGGATYAIVKNGLLNDHTISPVAVNPQNPNMLFVGQQGGIFKSTNGGDLWTLATAAIDTSTISFDAKFNPPVVYINGAKSLDLGVTWRTIPGIAPIIVDPSTPNSLFGFTSDPQSPNLPLAPVWSRDGGSTWVALGDEFGNSNIALGFGGGSIAVAQTTPQVLFGASLSNGILRLVVGP